MRRAAALLALLLSAGAAAAPGAAGDATHLRFQVWAADSLPLHSRYYPPASPGAPLVMFLHDRRGRGDDWRPLAEALQARGIGSLLPDLRGCGRSVRAPRAVPAAPSRWDAAFWHRLAEDLEAVMAFVDRQPGLAGRERVLVATGESAGLALALFAADRRWSRLALLSPLLPEPAPPVPELERPVLLLACEGDREAVVAARRLAKQLPPALRRVEYPECSSRGPRMLRWLPALTGQLGDWILE
ncbi:MAG: alpha/beta hydrolase [Candidatus Krumholzibacteriota bacterium]|nr:alpha/beta hydrolase [Candidatus Krumholzibacteriota bacterium]